MNKQKTEEEDEPRLDERTSFQAVPNHSRNTPAYTDREMWIAIRSGILGIVSAIDMFASDKPLAMAVRPSLMRITAAIELRWGIKRHKVN